MAESIAVDAARWVVGKALSPLSGGLVEAWAASSELGCNVDALKTELLYVRAMLSKARGRQLDNPDLTELLQKLRDLAYNAEDVLDELDYFRIQDELDGTYEAANEHAKGCLHGLALNARHTARSVGSKLKFSSSAATRDNPDDKEDDPARRGCAWPCGGRKAHDMVSSPTKSKSKSKNAFSVRNTIEVVGKHLPCCSSTLVQDNDDAGMLSSPMSGNGRQLLCGAWPCKAPQSKRVVQTPKLKFDRVQISARMKDIIEQLKPVCAKVLAVLNLDQLLGSSRSTAPDIAKSRPITTPESIEPTLYGRDTMKNGIIYDITQGKYRDRGLTVLPIVGPGGIGKTTLTQHIYKEVEDHFDVKIWVCVSLNFNVYRLTEEIEKKIPKLDNEEIGNPDKLIEQRVKHKKFLLVLDDMWNCVNEDEWKRLLLPFIKGQKKGSIILVTTRFPELAEMVKTSDYAIPLEGLDDGMFWRLFLVYVFGDEQSGKDHDDLLETGENIVKKLKGSPLAAKTVGRLLRNRLDLDHWTRVLESKEWELQSGEHDIMPALKLSYDYLDFHLQQCFTYCALFPEDYKFEREELVHLWIGLDILSSHGQNNRIEDTGLSYLNDLVNRGFLKMDKKEDGRPCYAIHDLLHELALKVSSHECLSIYSSNVRSIQIPPSIRHLSIIIDDTDVKDRMAFENHKEDLRTLDKRLKVENLHSLMLFGKYHGSFAKIFANLFRDAKALRIILLSGASYNVEELLHNFSKLIHLRYLRIKKAREFYWEISLPSTISRFYHLRVLDLKECYRLHDLPRDMSNLVKMRHFLVRDEKLHSDISEVGKVKYLQELRRFGVKKDINGFELRQLGHLVEIGGSLHICNLENVQEADEAKLMHKNRLHELTLEWDINRSNKDPTQEERVLESLKPHNNLRKLCIRGHGGTTCPTWLGVNLSTKSLKSLCLDDIAWNKLPTLGEMHGEEFQGCITGQSFQNLKRLELVKIPRLKKWVGNNTCYLFSHLEVLTIKGCSELVELPFSNSTCNQPEQEANINGFPSLRELNIVDCPKLLSLPPIPWNSGLCSKYYFSSEVVRVGLGFEHLFYSKYYFSSEVELQIKGDGSQDSVSWKMLAFNNLIELKRLVMKKCPPLPLDHLQMLTSLKVLKISDSNNVLSPVEGEGQVRCPLTVEDIEIERCGASGKELTQLLSHFPKLTQLRIEDCEKITGLGVVEQRTMATPASSSSSAGNKMKHAQTGQQQEIREGDETAAEGLLLLPPQIQELTIKYCLELSLRANSLDGGTGEGGLQGLHSLRSLYISVCPMFLSSSSGFPFPTSLQYLNLECVGGMATLAPLSNLSCLTKLYIGYCGDLSGEDLWPLLTQGHLIELVVFGTPNFFIGSELSRPQELLCHSSKLPLLVTDDVAGVLAAPVCGILSSSLTTLDFSWNEEVERFTEEQEKALHLLTSLQELEFHGFHKLQCLPAGLHRLTNLKKLEIDRCLAIRSLAKGVLPSSLQELHIASCPAIRSLHKDGLPSSLRVLDIRHGNSKELSRQCRKLTGTIPIIEG